MVHCFTSFTFSYLSRALILARTLKQAHPDWVIWGLLVDFPPPGFEFDRVSSEFDRIVYANEMGFTRFKAWLFKHDVVEACTAVKGEMLRFLLEEEGAEKALYIDPDIAIFHPLDEVVSLLDDHAIILTPHQTAPEVMPGPIWDNEVSSLRHGVYNLGFIAVSQSETGLRFSKWWAERLHLACYAAVETGIFTDQKWCDLVPSFFDGVKIHRDPGCNVASWNLSNRALRVTSSGKILVNESPLKFYHFTKIGSEGDAVTEKYAGDNTEVYEIWNWYKRTLRANEFADIPKGYWHYGNFSNGDLIPKSARILFREREDLFNYFDDPFEVDGNSFHSWLGRERPDILGDQGKRIA